MDTQSALPFSACRAINELKSSQSTYLGQYPAGFSSSNEGSRAINSSKIVRPGARTAVGNPLKRIYLAQKSVTQSSPLGGLEPLNVAFATIGDTLKTGERYEATSHGAIIYQGAMYDPQI